MSKPVKKINQLNNTESFLQAHTMKGFKYIDKAGEIINLYTQDKYMPNFSLNIDGLIIEKPTQDIETLKVTPTFIWMKFNEIDNLGNIERFFIEQFEKIIGILEVSELTRLGWRNYFIHEFSTSKQEEKFLEKIKVLPEAQTEIIRLKLNSKQEFEITLSIQPLVKLDNPAKKAVLFDVDIFKKGNIKISDVKTLLNSFKDYLQDKTYFLGSINKFLK